MVRVLIIALAAASTASLGACQFVRDDINKTLGRYDGPEAAVAADQLSQAGINPFLWRAALDTLAFAAIEQAEPANRAIATGWHSSPANPNERVRVVASVLDRELRADSLRVAITRQVNQGGQWVEAPVAAATVQRLEEIILSRANDLSRAARL